VLGIRNGLRYWRLQNKAIRDPFMALRWASEIRHEAKLEAEKGNKLTAALMDCFADDMMERNRKFHTPNVQVDLTGGPGGPNLEKDVPAG
jgi:hypothetical protein